MKARIRKIQRLSARQLISILIRSAKMYSQYADTDLLFLFRHSKTEIYEGYEVHFGKRNFMHLAGIKSKTLSAIEFYEACFNGTITMEDCTPRHTITNMHSKISIMEQILDFRFSKLYKIGKKDLVTHDNDFEMATGNGSGVLGYDSRISSKGSKRIAEKELPIPTTLLTSPITDYCTQPEKIMFILQKDSNMQTYDTVFYEIKSGLLQTESDKFPLHIQNLIGVDNTSE